MGLFNRKKDSSGKTIIPMWFMRQAGRYHDHYQALRANHSFETLCKDPQLACEVTMGPIDAFDFDAAILFSDLLFPLEQLGLGLSYASGRPELPRKITTVEDALKLKEIEDPNTFFAFQKKSIELVKAKLPQDKDLLGFVGGPVTLFTYGVCGTHTGSLLEAKTGLYDGRFDIFCEKLIPNLLVEMKLQAEAGANAVAILDTAAGELSPVDYQRFVMPSLKEITSSFKKSFPNTKVIYYAKHSSIAQIELIDDPNIDVLGVDYRHDIAEIINRFSDRYYIQGNIDPCWLHLPWEQLESNLKAFLENLHHKNINFDRWICGLGHGVLPQTPQENVRKTVNWLRENIRY